MLLLVVLLSFSIPFTLLAVLPGWRSLLIGAAIAFFVTRWAWLDVLSDDSPGVIIAGPLVGIAGFGFAAGCITRIVLLERARLRGR